MATCPFHGGAICSLCCSTDGACKDACKPNPWRPVGAVTSLGMPAMSPALAGVPAPATRPALSAQHPEVSS
jgi:hypothetical protein